mmetsp:Transcript_15786/g.40697  ORF Transcript_15786/g.40697 Transcript_15786/m.40697 type:complete len:265 (-) Transcript_15786:616-1410(-)
MAYAFPCASHKHPTSWRPISTAPSDRSHIRDAHFNRVVWLHRPNHASISRKHLPCIPRCSFRPARLPIDAPSHKESRVAPNHCRCISNPCRRCHRCCRCRRCRDGLGPKDRPPSLRRTRLGSATLASSLLLDLDPSIGSRGRSSGRARRACCVGGVARSRSSRLCFAHGLRGRQGLLERSRFRRLLDRMPLGKLGPRGSGTRRRLVCRLCVCRRRVCRCRVCRRCLLGGHHCALSARPCSRCLWALDFLLLRSRSSGGWLSFRE